ncbi:MAG: integrase/recombinase XerD [Bacteriovoracaceae bacterium]|jgi:site-specific recombinase XerD
MKKNTVRIKRLRNNKYEIAYTDPFTKRRIRKRANTHEDAKSMEKQITRMFDNTKLEHLQLLTINELLEMHFEHYPNTKVDSRRIPYESFVKNFGRIEIRNISPSNIKMWMEDLKEQHDYAEVTMGHIKGSINHFFRFLVEEGIIIKSPLDYYKIDKSVPPKKERIFYTHDEIKLILKNANEYSPRFLFPFITFLVHTGARKMEAVELTWKNVDFALNIIKITDVKSGSRRPMKMSASLRKVIEGLPHTSKYVLTNPKGEKIGRSQLHRHLQSLHCTYETTKPLACHAFRHSFAYNFLRNGGQMYELMAVLGHKNIGLTINLYGQLKSEDVEDPSPYKF